MRKKAVVKIDETRKEIKKLIACFEPSVFDGDVSDLKLLALDPWGWIRKAQRDSTEEQSYEYVWEVDDDFNITIFHKFTLEELNLYGHRLESDEEYKTRVDKEKKKIETETKAKLAKEASRVAAIESKIKEAKEQLNKLETQLIQK